MFVIYPKSYILAQQAGPEKYQIRLFNW